jgi:hypothetical protein
VNETFPARPLPTDLKRLVLNTLRTSSTTSRRASPKRDQAFMIDDLIPYRPHSDSGVTDHNQILYYSTVVRAWLREERLIQTTVGFRRCLSMPSRVEHPEY